MHLCKTIRMSSVHFSKIDSNSACGLKNTHFDKFKLHFRGNIEIFEKKRPDVIPRIMVGERGVRVEPGRRHKMAAGGRRPRAA